MLMISYLLNERDPEWDVRHSHLLKSLILAHHIKGSKAMLV